MRKSAIFLLVLALTSNNPVFAQTSTPYPHRPIPILNKFNLHFSVRDLAVPSHDLPIEFTRTYNSAFAKETGSPLGPGWTHGYRMRLEFEKGDPELAVFTDEGGRRFGFERRLDGSYISPPVIHAALTEDLDRTSYTLTFKDKTTYFFNKEGRLESIKTKNNNSLSFQYGEQGRLAGVASSAGAKIELLYNGDGRLTRVKDSAGRETRFSYDGAGRLTKEVSFLGDETSYTYEESGRLSEVKDPLGRVLRVAYDGIGNMTSVTDPEGRETSYTFIASGYFLTEERKEIPFPNMLTVTDPLGNKTVTSYDDLGHPIDFQDAAGNKTFYLWSRLGDLTGVIDPQRGRTEFVYDESSNLIAVADPLRNRAELLYDGQDRLIEFKDPKGNVTEYGYDKEGRLSEVRNPEGGVTRLAYTPEGEITSYRDPEGHATGFAHNPLGQVVSVTDAKGGAVTYRYDEKNELSLVTNQKGEEKKVVTDWSLRQRKVVTPGGQWAYTYDKAGRLVSASDADSTITFEYNSLDQITKVSSSLSLRPPRSRFDAGRGGASATKQSPPARTEPFDSVRPELVEGPSPLAPASITYEYDVAGRRTKMTDPAGETTYAYDKTGNLIEMIPPTGESILFEYDKAGRRTAVLFPNSVKISYRYDLAGNLLQLKNENLQTKQIISQTAYVYDDLGNCISKRDAQGETVYAYDKLSRLIEVTDTPQSSPVSRPVPLAPVSITYTYDKAGNRLTRTVTPPPAFPADGGFNRELNRLEEPKSDGEVNGAKEEYAYNELNQLLKQGNTAYEYDPLGNLTAKREGGKTTRYAYNAANLLEKAKLPDGAEVAYRYDPVGRRVSKQSPRGLTQYVYDAEDEILELGPEQKPARRTLHGPGIDDLLGSTDYTANESSYYLTDRLGSITDVLDGKGTAQESFTYGPFGEIAASSDGQPSLRGAERRGNLIPTFTGRQFDSETGLYYYRSRYYAPQAGRFTTADPIGLLGGPNLYTYVNNNPVNWIDPWGLKGEDSEFPQGEGYVEAVPIWEDPIAIGLVEGAASKIISFPFKIGTFGVEPTHIGMDVFGWNIIHYGRHIIHGRHIGLLFGKGKTALIHIYKNRIFIKFGQYSKDIRFLAMLPLTLEEIISKLIETLKMEKAISESEVWLWYSSGEFLSGGENGGTGAPEPATLVLSGMGVATLALFRRKKRRGR